MEPYLLPFPHISPCYCYRCPFGKEYPTCAVACAEELERIIQQEGAETIAAFIAEPIVGTSAAGLVDDWDFRGKRIRTLVNGEVKQNFNTSDMAHKIPRCIEWVSSIHALEPGDVLATGTNHRGLSAFQNGDVVELEVQGLGRLRINVHDELKRTWAREARLEREQKGQQGLTPQLTGKYAAAR